MPVTPGRDIREDFDLLYRRFAEVADRLARTEHDAARIFESLAERGGDRTEQRLRLAQDAAAQAERLRAWSGRLRARCPD